MKKALSIFVVLISTSSVMFAGGIDDPKSSSKIALVKKDENHFRLIYKSNKISNVEVAIYNDQNQLQFTEVIRKVDGFARPYNFSNLERGKYTIVVKNSSDENLSESVKIAEVNPVLTKSSLMAQVIKMKENNKYLLTVSDQKSKFVTIRISDEENTTLYEKRESITGQMAKLFSFNNLNNLYIFTVVDQFGNPIEVIKRNTLIY